MANPAAPTDAGTRRIPFDVDPDHPGDAFLPVGSGKIDMGAGRTRGSVRGALGWGLGSSNADNPNGAPVQRHVADVFTPFDLTAVTTEQLAWTPTSGKAARLLAVHIKASVETTVDILDGTGGPTLLTIGCPAGVPVTLPLGDIGILSSAPDNALYLASSDAADLAGTLMGSEEG